MSFLKNWLAIRWALFYLIFLFFLRLMDADFSTFTLGFHKNNFVRCIVYDAIFLAVSNFFLPGFFSFVIWRLKGAGAQWMLTSFIQGFCISGALYIFALVCGWIHWVGFSQGFYLTEFCLQVFELACFCFFQELIFRVLFLQENQEHFWNRAAGWFLTELMVGIQLAWVFECTIFQFFHAMVLSWRAILCVDQGKSFEKGAGWLFGYLFFYQFFLGISFIGEEMTSWTLVEVKRPEMLLFFLMSFVTLEQGIEAFKRRKKTSF